MTTYNASSRDLLDNEERHIAEKKIGYLFQSFGINAETQRDRLIYPYLDRAAQYGRRQSQSDLARFAIEEVEADLDRWFGAILEDQLGELDSPVMVGRAAFWMCDGPNRWSDQLLLSQDELAAPFVAALRDSTPNAVPPSDIGEMHHQPYEAWSPTSALTRALPFERGSLISNMQNLLWRDTDPTS